MLLAIRDEDVWKLCPLFWALFITIYWMVLALRATRAHERLARAHEKNAVAQERMAASLGRLVPGDIQEFISES